MSDELLEQIRMARDANSKEDFIFTALIIKDHVEEFTLRQLRAILRILDKSKSNHLLVGGMSGEDREKLYYPGWESLSVHILRQIKKRDEECQHGFVTVPKVYRKIPYKI